MKKYDLIDHTADIGVKAYGENLSECYENAAIGMFDIITDKSSIKDIGKYFIDLEAGDLEQLLVDWLSELLFLNSAKNLVFGKFKININRDKCRLKEEVYGEEFDNSRHSLGSEIKAVTYHMLEVNDKEPFSVQVLFDI